MGSKKIELAAFETKDKCPKCKSDLTKTTYCESNRGTAQEQEYLTVKCAGCGYKWCVATADGGSDNE